jgi:RNA polymerase sigma factor (sigma-70 family)
MEIITKDNYRLLFSIANKQYRANKIVNTLELEDFCSIAAEWVVKYSNMRPKFDSDLHYFSTIVNWVVRKYCLSEKNRNKANASGYWSGFGFECKIDPSFLEEKKENIMDTSFLDKTDLMDVYQAISKTLEGREKDIMECVLDGYSQEEIADYTGMTRTTVGRDYRSAISKLKRELRI